MGEPKVFGWQHWLFLLFFVVAVTVSIFLLKKYKPSERAIRRILRIAALVHLGLIIFSRIAMTVWLEDWMSLFPDSFCSLSSVLLPIGMLFFLRKDGNYLHFIWYFALIGGVVTIVYPDFLSQDPSFFFPPTISGLLHHAMMAYNAILLVATGYFTPTLKKWYCLPLGGACVMTYGIFLLTALGEEDALHIETPLIEGTPLTWYVVVAIALTFSFLLMLAVDYFRVWRKKPKRVEEAPNEEGIE